MAHLTSPPRLRIADHAKRPMPRRITLTEANVRRLVCPAGKSRIRVYDAKVIGLTCNVTAGGARAFYFYGRVKGFPRPVEYHIGSTDAISVDRARDAAKQIAADAASASTRHLGAGVHI